MVCQLFDNGLAMFQLIELIEECGDFEDTQLSSDKIITKIRPSNEQQRV